MKSIGFTAIRRGQFVGLHEPDGSWRIARAFKCSAAGAVKQTVHPADWIDAERGVPVRIDRREPTQHCAGLDSDHNAAMARSTEGLTRADLTYPTKREMQLDILRMLGYAEADLDAAGVALRGGISISEYLHTTD